MKTLLFFTLTCIASLAFSQDFNIYVSDAGNFDNPPWQILKFDSNGENPEIFIDKNLDWPQDILFLEGTSTVLISNLGSNRITIHDDETGEFIGNFATDISGPTRTKIGPDGFLYVLQWNGNGKVRRYELDGNDLGEFSSVGVNQSIGLDWDMDGNLYVSSYNGDSVRKFDTDGVDQGLFIDSNLLGPTNIWFDDNGDLLVSDYNGTAVKRFDNTGTFIGDFMTGLSQSEGVAYLPNGEILMGNGATHSVKRFAPDGSYIDDIIPNSSGNLLTPNAVVLKLDSPLSTSDRLSSKKRLIVPTLGSSFQIDSIFAGDIAKIEVYNMAGFFVDSFTNLSWQANRFANGTYLVSIQFTDGTIHTEKIIVKK